MEQQPTPITPVLLVNMIVAFIVGGVVGYILMSFSPLPKLWVGILSGFIPIVIGGYVKTVILSSLAKLNGVKSYAQQPTFPLLIRLIIGFAISAVVAYYFVEVAPARINFIIACLIGLISSVTMMLVMFAGTLIKK